MTKNSYLQNLLVPLDGSRLSLQAEEVAADLAKKFGSKVTAVHVVSHEVRHPSAARGYRRYQLSGSVQREIEAMVLQKGDQILAEAKTFFMSENVPVETVLEEFVDPAESILDLAQEKKSDMIIMGNRGEIEDLTLGGVAEKVTRHAKCSVLVVKKKSPLKKILAAVDGSSDSMKALEFAVEISMKYGSEMALLYVARTMLPQFGTDAAKMMAEQILSKAETHSKDIGVQKRVLFGHPVKEIVNVVKDEGFDLVALGSRGVSPARRFLLGSVSEGVARSVPCSVLIGR